MKYIFSLFLIAFASVNLTAQITLENTYQDVYLKFTSLEDQTDLYYSVDSNVLSLYEMNHSVHSSINLPFTFSGSNQMVYFVTDKLFDTDSDIEFLHITYWTGQNGEAAAKGDLKVYDDDGSVLLSVDSVLVDRFHFTQGSGSPMIVKTDAGTKLLLRKAGPAPKKSMVYSLGGNLYESIQEHAATSSTTDIGAHLYPNPAKDRLKLNYSLPIGHDSGMLKLFNTNGQLIRSFKVNNRFDNVLLNIDEVDSGNYYYLLESNGVRSAAQKLIIAK